ncbi:MAG: penicillin-binding protein [Alphaproteobacteria bacterium]|nr:penicillin-binding protein [Alphaproteobacteria bacterium]
MGGIVTSDRPTAPQSRPLKSRVRRWLSLSLVVVFMATAAVLSGGAWWIASLGPPPLGEALAFSTLVVDRDGKLLRPYTTLDGRWRLPAGREQVDPRFLQLLLAYEDKRFDAHRGVDPLALGRALTQLIGHGRIISGASTITMQVARLLEPRTERSFTAKLRQMVRAIELETTLSKDEILALYLSLAPYGGNLEGVRAASLAYFGKEPRRLTLGEAALLVALPQSPEQRRPDRSMDAARNARDRVLDRLTAGVVPSDEIARAKHETVPDGRKPMPMLAPHAANAVIAAAPDRGVHRLTIDATLQRNLEDLARERARALGPDISVAIVAVDHGSGEVLARVASADYFDTRRSGQVDMTAAVRSPGSTLKPFIYGLGFEDGLIHPDTLIEDRPIRFGSYAPENFDLTFQGTVTVRRALQLSLNVPAVAVLDKVGANRFAARLEQAGGSFALPEGEVPGLAIGLGGVGVKLTDLVALYAGLARLGTTVPLSERVANGGDAAIARRLLDPVAAWYVGSILLGTPPPENAAGGRIAFKTGTSYGYRDAWALGFDGRYTIGVWVGRPDGAPVPGLLGRVAAAPILFDAFARTGKLPAALPRAPNGALVAATAKLPPPLQRFLPGTLAGENTGPQLRIMFPPNGARLELASDSSGKPDPVALKVTGGAGPLTVLVNGMPVPASRGTRTLFFEPEGPGFVRLTVMDGRGAIDSVVVRLQ